MSPNNATASFNSVPLSRRTTLVVRLGSGAGKPGPAVFAFLMVLQMAFTKGYPNNSLENRSAISGEYHSYTEYTSYTEYLVTWLGGSGNS